MSTTTINNKSESEPAIGQQYRLWNGIHNSLLLNIATFNKSVTNLTCSTRRQTLKTNGMHNLTCNRRKTQKTNGMHSLISMSFFFFKWKSMPTHDDRICKRKWLAIVIADMELIVKKTTLGIPVYSWTKNLAPLSKPYKPPHGQHDAQLKRRHEIIMVET